MTKTIPAWAMAGVIAVTLPLTGWFIVEEVQTIKAQVTDTRKSIEDMVGVIATHSTELKLLATKQEASDKFFSKAIENQVKVIDSQANMLNELQRINRTIRSAP